MATTQFIPPHDIYKAGLINERQNILELMKEIDFYLGMKRVPKREIKSLKASVKNFYRNLRPKIILNVENGKLYNYGETIIFMDYFLQHGSEFSLAWCMEMVNQVFAFVEEHGITSLVPVSHSEERRSDIV